MISWTRYSHNFPIKYLFLSLKWPPHFFWLLLKYNRYISVQHAHIHTHTHTHTHIYIYIYIYIYPSRHTQPSYRNIRVLTCSTYAQQADGWHLTGILSWFGLAFVYIYFVCVYYVRIKLKLVGCIPSTWNPHMLQRQLPL